MSMLRSGATLFAYIYIYALVLIFLKTYWDYHKIAKVGILSSGLCGFRYSEAESGRWKSCDYMLYGPGAKLSKATLYMTYIMYSIYIVFIVGFGSFILFRVKQEVQEDLKKKCTASGAVLIILGLVYLVTFVLCFMSQMSWTASPLVAQMTTKTTADMIEYTKKINKNLTAFLLSGTVLLGTFIAVINIEKISKSVIQPGFELDTDTFTLLGVGGFGIMFVVMYFFTNTYVNTINTSVIRYKNECISSITNDPKLLQSLAGKLYNCIKAVGVFNNTDYNAYREPLRQYLARNIQLLDNTVAYSDAEIAARKDDLWKYVFHNDGKELNTIADELAKSIRSVKVGQSGATGATLAANDLAKLNSLLKSLGTRVVAPKQIGNDKGQSALVMAKLIFDIRTVMAKMRRNTEINEYADKTFYKAVAVSFIIFGLSAYGMFHKSYMHESTVATGAVAASILGIVIICIFISIFSGTS